ncbi:hypothetical protein GW17_00061469 [Ensete ventricosum]|nr:hypothetical protein GW17_00061469 [Ensete ventricosum]
MGCRIVREFGVTKRKQKVVGLHKQRFCQYIHKMLWAPVGSRARVGSSELMKAYERFQCIGQPEPHEGRSLTVRPTSAISYQLAKNAKTAFRNSRPLACVTQKLSDGRAQSTANVEP